MGECTSKGARTRFKYNGENARTRSLAAMTTAFAAECLRHHELRLQPSG